MSGPILLAGGVLSWLCVRAILQSITIDEADTFLDFVNRGTTPWIPAANNQILNTLLMRLSTALFGVSELTLRLPALLGGAAYLCGALYLCARVTRNPVLRTVLFACLTLNPFVMDYLVAARGYGLGIGFLLLELAFGLHALEKTSESHLPLRTGVAFSLSAGLSFLGNFSFALIDGSIWLLIAIGVFSLSRPPREALARALGRAARILAAFALPGLAVSLYLSNWLLKHWSRGQLVFGAKSVSQMTKSVWNSSLYEVNEYLADPATRQFLQEWSWIVPALVIAACAVRLGSLWRDWRGIGSDSTFLRRLAVVAFSGFVMALGGHLLLFRVFHVLLPMSRTALWMPPLLTLLAGVLAAFPAGSRLGAISSKAVSASLILAAAYFFLCLRLHYFEQWRFDADVKGAYAVASYYNHKYGVKAIPSCWKYVAALNYYRVASGKETIQQFVHPGYPLDRQVYVLEEGFDDAFIEQQKLKVVYYGAHRSGIRVAIRPELEAGGQP